MVKGNTQRRSKGKACSKDGGKRYKRWSISGTSGKELTCHTGDERDMGSVTGLGRSPGEGYGNPLPVFLPREPYGQRSLAGSGP